MVPFHVRMQAISSQKRKKSKWGGEAMENCLEEIKFDLNLKQ